MVNVKMTKKDNRKRGIPIQVYLSEEEHADLTNKCKKNDISLSYYVRTMITEGEIKNNDTYSLSEIMKEMNSIGNEINGIAKKVNERGSLIGTDNEELRDSYKKLFAMVLDKIMGIN